MNTNLGYSKQTLTDDSVLLSGGGSKALSALAGSGLRLDSTNKLFINKRVPFVIGTQTEATGSWTGICNDIDALYDGLTIVYWLPYAGSGNATLNLTINGVATGAKNCYYGGTSRLTTHYGANNVIFLTYRTSGAGGNEGWWAHSLYYSSDTTTQQFYYTRLKAGTNGMMSYSLVMQDGDNKWQSFTTTSGTSTSKTKNTAGFKLGSRIYYMNMSSNVSANNYSGYGTVRPYQGLVDMRYSFNNITAKGTGLTYNKPVYIVGTIGTNNLFYLSDAWWTLDEPTTEDGKIYIRIAESVYPDYDTSTYPNGNYRADLISDGYAYWFKDGKFRRYHTTNNLTINGTAYPVYSSGSTLPTLYAVATSNASAANQVWMRNADNNAYAWRTLGSNAFNSTSYLPLSGGEMSGPLTWKNSSALPANTSPEYFLVTDSFANGGKTKYTSLANLKTAIGISSYLPLSGGTMTGHIKMGTSHYIYGAEESGGSILYFDGTRTVIGSIGTSSTAATHIRSSTGHATIGTGNSATYTIWDSGNDGSGSGLDADTVDGIHASSFAFQQADNNLINHGNEFTFVGSGYNSLVWFNYRTCGGTNGSISGYYFGNGNKSCASLYAANYYTSSDRNKKMNIIPLSLHISKFTLKDSGKDAYGVIAQEVPEMFRDGEDGNMTVNYNSILSYYIGMLENKVKELENRIKQLENG